MTTIINRIASNFQRFINQSVFIIKMYLLGILIFFITRIIFILNFGNLKELSVFKLDLGHSFITGLRFDTVVLTFSLLLLLLLSLVNLFLRTGTHKEQKVINKIFIGFSTLVLSFVVFICITNFFYYKFFSSHFNINVFGLIDDDTKSLLKSIWVDYPVIRITLFLIVAIFIIQRLAKRFYYSKSIFTITKGLSRASYAFVLLLAFMLGMRCSFGNVPLEFMEASISPNTFINNIPINGVFALKNAIEEKIKGQIDISQHTYLEKFGFKNNTELLSDYIRYFGSENDSTVSPITLDSISFVKTSEDPFLAENPPNIVFLQMESMSTYFFNLHSENFNLLGSLEQELKNCIVFQNFLSCRNLTILSMDGLIVNSPLSPLSQSEYLNVSFPSSSIVPFLKSGYETTFITGGRLNWRNLDQFLPRQGFNKLEGGADIKKHCPNAIEEHEWGVYDEFLMERIVQKLHEKQDKPQFIYGVSITYHTPYKYPLHYKPMPLNLKGEIKKLLNSTDEATRQTFVCYQYMCDALGWLIHEITNSELADNTIIIATGDHSSHLSSNLFGFTDKDIMKLYSVPLIMYVPEKYKKELYIDTTRFGSHKDIFPTIFNMALSNASYFKSGNDLFSSDTTTNYFGLYQNQTAINNAGCAKYHNNNNFTYYRWLNKKGGELGLDLEPSQLLIELGNASKAYSAFNIFQTILQIKEKKNIVRKVVAK
ncbi:MAG: LTA synthase family protein [Salinivirgaceae bacterium]|nr:LTA synthase family protein [Salinivirgaceae bacterium]